MSTSWRACLTALATAVFWAVFAAAAAAQGSSVLDRPLGSIHNSGNWGENPGYVMPWEQDPSGPLLPPSYVEYLKSTHINWVGISVSLHVDDSMDSIVKRKYSPDIRVPTFTDEVIRQIASEYRQHGIDVYLTLAFELNEALEAERPVGRHIFGDPGDPEAGKPLGYGRLSDRIDPEFWPWRPSHPDHERFVAEFWRTYTEQAVHFARIAQEEGVRMFSLGTETDSLFRTRPGGYWPNDFIEELRAMVASVRAVYDGLLTYDMNWPAYTDHEFVPGSRHLWEDLDLDVVGVSSWFPPVEEPPTMVLSVERFRREYERIFRDYLLPVAAINERPIVFLEYGIVDTVDDPANPSSFPADEVPFSDMNGNGLDDGQEQQANVIEAMLGTVSAYPGVVYGAFFWDNWIASSERWARSIQGWARTYSFRGKLGEHAVRARYEHFRSLLWLPAKMLFVGEGAHVVPVELPNASTYTASSSAPEVATVTVSGSRVSVSPVAGGVAAITVTGDGAADTLQFTVVVEDLEAEPAALEALYRATDGDNWTNSTNWLTDAPFEEWYGVAARWDGHVTGLQLGALDESARDFVGNGLVGSLPPELGDLTHLRRLAIEGNELAGPIPTEVGKLTELRDLYLSSNGLTGPVPSTLGNLTNLQRLNLGGNALTGTIPTTLANLTRLTWLSLWGNDWTSEPAPEWVGELTDLRALDLGGHQFTGPIPAMWRNLGKLEDLFLWGNALTGSIPAWFGSLAKLRTLDLNGNPLTGPIPASLTRLSDLAGFDIASTGVCVPDDPAIHAWLAAIVDFRSSGLTCEGSPPVVVATLPNRTLVQDGTLDVDVSQAFSDPDGDPLTYTVWSSAPHVVTAVGAGARVRLTGMGAGTATIRVTATDPGGLSAAQSFTVTVSTTVSGSFTDDPIQPGVTPVRAVHFTELRTRIDALRAGTSLGRFAWTDPVLRARVTPVRRVHVLELRQALAEAYSASGRAAPRWTDASPAAGSTPIRALHVTELRAAVLALE